MRRAFLLLVLSFSLMVTVSPFLSIPVSALDEYNCLQCHSDPSLKKQNGSGNSVSLYVRKSALDASAHRYIDCTTCHLPQTHLKIPQGYTCTVCHPAGHLPFETPLTKLSLAEKCGTCHQYEYGLHLQSIHGQQLVQGNPDVATCVDCHSADATPHNVIRVLEYNAPTYKKNISQTCARCHGNKELMERYGIVEKVYESYMRSFHGKAIQLGTYEISQLDKATCTNCHGTHDIKLITDPQAPVAGRENLAKVCEQCHPNAGVEFARGFLGHKEASLKESPVVYYAERFFLVLTVSTLSLGAIIIAMAGIRWLIRGWKAE